MILVFARRTYWEVREWRWGKLPPDERFGFSNPLAEHPRAAELGLPDMPGRDDEAEPIGTAATGSSHPRA